MTTEQFIKTAFMGEFVDEALSAVKDNFDFKDHPFQTIFATVGSAWLAGKIPVIGFLVYVAEAMGYGPGQLGKLIDESLGYGKGKTPDISNVDEASNAASTNVIESLCSAGRGIIWRQWFVFVEMGLFLDVHWMFI